MPSLRFFPKSKHQTCGQGRPPRSSNNCPTPAARPLDGAGMALAGSLALLCAFPALSWPPVLFMCSPTKKTIRKKNVDILCRVCVFFQNLTKIHYKNTFGQGRQLRFYQKTFGQGLFPVGWQADVCWLAGLFLLVGRSISVGC